MHAIANTSTSILSKSQNSMRNYNGTRKHGERK